MFTGLDWYVSPAGSPQGDGSRGRPWDVATAFAHPAQIEPGDVVWLAGGVYQVEAPLRCELAGTAETRIEVWGDPDDEPAVVELGDGRPHGMHLRGQYATYGDFTLRSRATTRWSDTPGSEGNPRGIGILGEAGPGVKLVRLRVEDFGTSMFESQPQGLQVLGCVFCNSYWDAPDRSHGPGLYIRNSAGAPRKRLENNVIYQHGRQGIQGFGSTPFAEIDVIGNILFNNGIADDGFHRNFMFGNAGDEHRNVVFEDNVTYFPAGPRLGHEYNLAGGDGGSHGLRLVGNWLAHPGRPALKVDRSDQEVIEHNRIAGDVELTSFDGSVSVGGSAFEARYPDNEYYLGETRPSGCWIRVRRDSSMPDLWRRSGRAYVAIFNWESEPIVKVDLSCLEMDGGLELGSKLKIGPVQNIAECVLRSYLGEPVEVPMAGWNLAIPAGRGSDKPLPPTFPEFGVFLVQWQAAGAPAARGPVRLADPGKELPPPAAHAARIAAWRTHDPDDRSARLAQRQAAWRAARIGRVV